MRTPRYLLVPAAAMMLTFALAASAHAQHVTIGKVIGGDGFHLPSYVAMDRGFFKAEGLDVNLVELDPKIQVTAVLSGNLDCAPIPSGGAQAALSGAKITYIVGQSLKSQWTITARSDINKVQDLKGLTIGYGHPGSSDYDEIQAVLHRFFQMDAGKDYKVIAFQGQPERIAALVNNNIQAAGLTVPHAAVAAQAGLKVLLRTGDYIPRAGGTIWCSAEFRAKESRDGEEDHPRHGQGGDLFPRRQARLDRSVAAPYRQHPVRCGGRPDLGSGAQHVRRRGAEGFVPRNLRIASPHHDRGAAVAGRQAAARSRSFFGA